MGSTIRYCFGTILITIFFCCGIALAEDQNSGKRLIEESLLILDPTVSPAKKFVIGGNLEYWYVIQDYDSSNMNSKINMRHASGSLEGSMPGYSFFVGYDDITLQTSYRDGDWEANQQGTVDFKKSMKDKEFELAVRYMFDKSRWFNPYVLLGYNYREIKVKSELTPPSTVWNDGSAEPFRASNYHNSILTGLGNITPINKLMGVKCDFRAMLDSYSFSDNTGRKFDDFGAWYRATLTGYVNIFEGINLQTGVRYDLMPAKVNDGQTREKIGFFASLGYSYKF